MEYLVHNIEGQVGNGHRPGLAFVGKAEYRAQQAVKLLHSKTGACVARHVYGVSDDIYEAIFWHTTGKADMTLLEKVLYLADYIEPSREEFPGLKELRRLAYEDLDQALLLGCRLTIEDMEERGVPVHTNTLQARDWLKGRNP